MDVKQTCFFITFTLQKSGFILDEMPFQNASKNVIFFKHGNPPCLLFFPFTYLIFQILLVLNIGLQSYWFFFLYSCITLIILAFALDLLSLSSVRNFSQEVLKIAGDKIDILINNAGIMMIEETITVDGNEKQMQVNHIGHFLLTQLLMPNLIRGSARIINVSSLAHTWSKSI